MHRLRLTNIFALLVVVLMISGCMAVSLIPAALTVGAAVSDSKLANEADASSKQSIEEKRNYQTRKFLETDNDAILKTLIPTLMSMGFTKVDYDSANGVGIASGYSYSMSWTFRKYQNNTYLRVSLISIEEKNIRVNWSGALNKIQKNASNKEYLDFWNSLGQVSFLRTIQLQPQELF